MPDPRKSPAAGHQLVFDLAHEPSLAEADFLVTDVNRMAFERVTGFPGWPSPLTLITGPAKSGKSHLARIWADRADAVLVLPEMIDSLTREAPLQPAYVEDVDRNALPETEFFNLLNQSMRDSRPLLMTARAPVADWPYLTNDVKSRARLAAHFGVDMPGDTQLSQLFVKLFADRQITVDPKIISYLVARMERSTEEVVQLVELMDQIALTRRSAITRPVAAQALAQRGYQDAPDAEMSGERQDHE